MRSEIAAVVLRGPWSRILDAVVAVAAVFVALGAWLGWRDGGGIGMAALTVVALVAYGTGWLMLRRTPSRWPAAIVVALATLVLMTLPGTPGLFAGFVATSLLVVAAGLRAAVAHAAIGVVAPTVQLFLEEHTSPLGLVLRATVLALFLTMGLLVGLLVRRLAVSQLEADELNARLQQANERLQASLDAERDLVLAEERGRQARELHDGLGHRLTLVGMSLQFAQRTRALDAVRAWAEVDRAAATNRAALDEMRVWVRALDPPALRPGLGTLEALEEIADSFRGTGLDVRVRHEGSEEALPVDLALFATRMVQEGLTNVLKHAGATRVVIRMVESQAQLRLSVRDDGDTTAAGRWVRSPDTRQGGFGLRSLAERAELLGGRLHAGALPGGGFEVAAVVPMARRAQEAG